MQKRKIEIGEYELDVLRLLERRLNQVARVFTLSPCDNGVIVEIPGQSGITALSTALAMLILHDISQMELAAITDKLSLSLVEKQEVLTDSIRCAHRIEKPNALSRRIKNYLEEQSTLHLSGFVRFRIPEVVSTWKLCVEGALEELLLEKEYMELMGVLRAFVQVKPARVREISLLLHPDGSCTLTDDSDTRIDYEHCDPDKLVSVLVELAPEKLTVYDLRSDCNGSLTNILLNVFADRIRIVR